MKRLITIFLDIDGVLNNEAALLSNHYEASQYVDDNCRFLSKENIAVLEYLVRQLKQAGCDVDIVLSSAWRHSSLARKFLDNLSDKHSILKFVGHTSNMTPSPRGDEISLYCQEHSINKANTLILDDGCNMSDFNDRLVRTYTRDGLTFKEAEMSLILLGCDIHHT